MLKKQFVLSALCLALFAVGCGDDDNPVNAHEGEEHAEAIGLIVRDSGAEIVRYENGQISGSRTARSR